jgi:hypothetical protein
MSASERIDVLAELDAAIRERDSLAADLIDGAQGDQPVMAWRDADRRVKLARAELARVQGGAA